MKRLLAIAALLGLLAPAQLSANPLNLQLRSEQGVPLTSAQFDQNYTDIENAIHALTPLSLQTVPVPVTSGGSGATTLTGVVVGAGTTPLTALPVLDVAHGGLGVGTITGLHKGNGTSPTTAAVAGTDFQAPSAELDCVAAASATGFRVRTGSGTCAQRTIVLSGGLTGTNLDGVAGNPTIVGSGGGSTTKRIVARNCAFVQPQVNGASATILSGTSSPSESFQIWSFADSVTSYVDWQCTLDATLPAGTGVDLKYCETSTVLSNVVQNDASIHRLDPNTSLGGSFTYTTNAQASALTMNATVAGRPTCGTIGFSSGINMNGAVAGDMINVRFWRDGGNVTDTSTGVAQLLVQSVYLQEQ